MIIATRYTKIQDAIIIESSMKIFRYVLNAGRYYPDMTTANGMPLMISVINNGIDCAALNADHAKNFI